MFLRHPQSLPGARPDGHNADPEGGAPAPWPLGLPRSPAASPRQHAAGDVPRRRSLSTWPTLLLLGFLVTHGTAEKLHARWLQWGQGAWPGYATWRGTVAPPPCTGGGAPTPQPGATADTADTATLDALLGADDGAPTDTAQAAQAAQQRCAAEQAAYAHALKALTPTVRAFRAVDMGLATALGFSMAHMRHALVLLLLICAAAATARRTQLALRPARGPWGRRLAAVAQLSAVLLLASSWATILRGQRASHAEVTDVVLSGLWLVGLAGLALLNAWHLTASGNRGLVSAPRERPSDVLLAVPLYATMLLAAGSYFLLAEQHPAGLAIYLQQLTEHALLYANVGLYVWIGMLLKETRLAEVCFGLLRPWALSPEMLAFVVVVLAAVPTAYSGASGIFVMAAGALIYKELRRAGAGDGMARAATALSGSLGVVLSPCLLVVIAASLNKQVTTDALYRSGRWVFLLTSGLYLLACLLFAPRRAQERLPRPAWRDVLTASRAPLRALGAYVLVAVLIAGGFQVLLGSHLDEHTAPIILPLILLAMLGLETWRTRRPARIPAAAHPHALGAQAAPERAARRRVVARDATPLPRHGAVYRATRETSGHIGSLLTLMSASVCVGGVVQRSGIMAQVPSDLGSPFVAMTVLLGMLVLIGMCMDPYGAVILVSASIAEVAYRNGIAPVHFWMVVLVAFELGYLMPPIALNQLLARRVIGEVSDAAADRMAPHDAAAASFWQRHLGLILPVGVMTCALLLVAFVPLGWKW